METPKNIFTHAGLTKIPIYSSNSPNDKTRLYFFSEQTKEIATQVRNIFQLKIKGRRYEGSISKIFNNIQSKPYLLRKADTFKLISKNEALQLDKGLGYHCLGLQSLSLGKNHEAIDYHKMDLKIALELRYREGEVRAYNNLGNIYFSLGDFSQSIEYHEKDLKIALEHKDLKGEGRAYCNLGNAYLSLGNSSEAMKYHEKCLKINLDLKDRLEEGKAYGNLGNVYRSLGNYPKAIDLQNKYLKTSQEFNDHIGQANAYCNLGIIYKFLGEYDKAIEYYEKQLTIARQMQDRIIEGKAYANLGVVFKFLKNYIKSEEYHKKDLEIALDLNDPMAKRRAYSNLGTTYFCSGDCTKARKYHKYVLTINQDLNNPIEEGKAYANLGNDCYGLGENLKAVEYHKKDLEIALKLDHPTGKIRAYSNLGNAYNALENYHEAEKNFRKSIELITLIQKNAEKPQWQVTLFEELSNPFIGLEKNLLLQNKITESLEISDSRRARALSSLISEKLPRQEFPFYSLKPLAFIKMYQLAQKLNTIFITYSLIELDEKISIHTWIVSPFQDPTSPLHLSLSFRVNEFKDINTILKTFPYGARPRVKKGEKATDAFQKHLSRWYELLIAPLEPYLTGISSDQSLTFIPDGFLAHLPFGAFYNASDQQYLIEKHPISVAPSIKILHLLDKLPKSPSDKVLLIGNPITPHERDNKLGFTEIEVRETLAPLMKVPSEQILTQKTATAKNLLKKAPEARLIHVACHGMMEENTTDNPDPHFDPHSVFKGLFKLAPDETYTSGLLRSRDIAEISLKADLVFMSACHLGRGNLKKEGSIGPIWSFLGAGAKSTIASYWPLPDSGVTVQMVETFYKHLLGIETQKLNKAQALQKAILMAMQNTPNKPYQRDNIEQWGAFFLSGLIE